MSKSLAVENLLEEALLHDRDLQKEARISERGDDLKKNPSVTDQGSCPRKVWYSLRNYPESNPPDVSSLANFLFGKAAEDAFVRVLQQFGASAEREIRVVLPATGSSGFPTEISGRLDVLLAIPSLKTIIELKTIARKAHEFMRRRGPGYRDEHRLQLGAYLLAGRRGLIPGIEPEWCDTGVLCYIIKDAAKSQKTFWAYEIDADERELESEFSFLADIHERALSESAPPQRPPGFTRDKFPCGWCNYQDTCWG